MKSFNPYVDDATHDLLMAMHEGAPIKEAMRIMTLAHADRLRDLSEVAVVALDPCPRCRGRLIAGDHSARCAAGCGYVYRPRLTPEPIASRRASP